MKHPLDESWAKIVRAHEHIDSLNAEAALWLQEMERNDDTISTRYEIDTETGWCEAFIANIPQAPPFRFGLIVGDVVHNLRSALDHLAWELANLNRPERGEDRVTKFPIASTPGEFKKRHVQLSMEHIHPDHREMIEEEQPYQPNGEENPSHPLIWIADLSNRDKHQGIHPVSVDIAAYYMHPYAIADATITEQTTYGADLEVGAKIMSMRIVATGPNPQMDVHPTILPPAVSLRSGNEVGRIDFVLPNLAEHVRQLVTGFKPVFG
jgi:hypothetical protein